MPRTTRELFEIASNHTDDKEVVTVTLNTPQSYQVPRLADFVAEWTEIQTPPTSI
jgi:hypothetical protein